MAEIMNASTERPVELVTVDRPEADETLTVPAASGLQIILAFNPADAGFSVEGDDFILTFEDGARIVFQGLVSGAQGADAPTIQIGGSEIAADVLGEQVLALGAEAPAEPIETAAGEAGEDDGAEGGGGSRYDDSFGDLIAGLAKQGVIGETELGFGLIGDGNTELPADPELVSDGHASGGGFAPLGVGIPSGSPSASAAPSVPSVPVSDSGDSGGGLEPLSVNAMDIITNEANGNLEIPDELLLYLANDTQGAGLSMAVPSHEGVNNAYIWDAGVQVLSGADPANTWANHVSDHVKFRIGNGNPLYEGSFTYEMSDGLGATGTNTVGVQNYETGRVGGYWTLDGTDADEVLLGLDGRNQINGFGGDDIIHGGHDSSGDILIGGDGNDVIFGGSGNDDLQGGDGDDTFIMRTGFGRDDVDGGAGTDTITLDSVLTGADVASDAAISNWLALDGDTTFSHNAGTNTITFDGTASGTIDLGGGNEITFVNIEQIDYASVA